MSADILGTSWDQCRSMVQCSFTSTETRRLVRTDSSGRPPRLSHSSWTIFWNVLCVWILYFWLLSGKFWWKHLIFPGTLPPLPLYKLTLSPWPFYKLTLFPLPLYKLTLSPWLFYKLTLFPLPFYKLTLSPWPFYKLKLSPSPFYKLTLSTLWHGSVV